MKDIRLLYIVTHPITAYNLMRGQLSFMRQQGFDVTLIASPGEELQKIENREGIKTIAIRIAREIRLFKDVLTLMRLYRSIRRIKPHVVNASTPKAGFLGMIAAWIARVPVRIYVLRGLRFETKHGLMRVLLVFIERITSALAHHVICVSPSLKEKYCALGIASRSKTLVLNEGSSNGIDITRFSTRSDSGDRQTLLNLSPNSQLIGFIGRLTRDKGILDLLDAFDILLPSFPNLHLLLVGDFEKGDPLPADCVKRINEHQRIVKKPFLNDPVPYYRVIDMLVFPSHREGFPNAPIEAAALGIPTVGFLATGTMDAVKNGITGTLVPIGDTPGLAKAVAYYLQNSEIRKRHGEAACARVHAQFRQEQIWQALQDTYTELVRCRTNKIENVDYQLNGSQKNF